MKKFFKTVTAMVIAAAMIGALALTGCGGSSSAPASSAASETKAESAAASTAASTAATSTAAESAAPAGDLTGKKIGMTLLMNDGLFAVFADYVQTLADACGVELILDVGAFSPEDQVASVENLIASGCDGILYCNFGETVLTKVCQICEEAEVYWAQYCRPVEDPEVLEALNSSKYYVGRTIEDNVQVGINIADVFKEMGVTKTAIIGTTPGDSTTEQVDQGYKQRAEELGLEIYTEVRNCEEAADTTKAIETVLSSFPDTEAVCLLAGNNGMAEGIFKGLENMGRLGTVPIGMLDQSATMADDLEAGYAVIGHIGQYVDPGFSFAILLNAVAGTPLSEDKIELKDQYIVLRSAEDAANYAAIVENFAEHKYAFTGDEFKQFIKVFNPDATLDTIQAAATAYSVDDVLARHGSGN